MAPGLDGIPSSLYKIAPHALSEYTYPLIFKAQLYGEEPLAFKGGLAIDIINKLTLPAPPQAFRNILLENDLAKHHHKMATFKITACCFPTH